MSTRPGWPERIFGIDARSLAAFRIAAGVLVVVDVVRRLPFLIELYTKRGPVYRSPFDSLFALVGEPWWPAALFGVLLVAGCLLAVGKWTRLATFVCWALLLDLHRRNPHVLDGGDNFFKHMLFWSLFLPLGARWSLDARSSTSPAPARVTSIASAALLMQPALVYVFSAILKWEHSMWRDGTAAYYAVAQDIWARPLADWVAARPGTLTEVLTWATLAAELFCPLFFFSPWRTSLARGIAIVSLIAMQAGFAFSLELGLFPFVSTAALLPLLPGGFWDQSGRPRELADARPRPGPIARVFGGIGAAALVVAVCLNLESVLRVSLLPGVVRRAGNAVIAQGWTMYEEVYKNDFRLVLHGLSRDGLRLALDDGGHAVRFAPLERMRGDYRAKMYLERLAAYEGEQRMFCDWVIRLWNQGDERPKIEAVELSLYQRRNPLPGEVAAESTTALIVGTRLER